MLTPKFHYFVFSVMLNLAEYIDEKNFARRMWGKYIHNEWKYDKYGAQGKLILLQEILAEEGLDIGAIDDYQKLINTIFPRTFYCLHHREVSAPLANVILKYFKQLEREFTEQGIPVNVVLYICEVETAEKFCLPNNTVKEIVNQK